MAKNRIGRNDRCACGSGKKYKNRCISAGAFHSTGILPVSKPIQDQQEQFLRSKREQIASFGKVRPIIQTDWRGKKVVAVGERVFASSEWKTFIDFLDDYIKVALTPPWGKSELAKPLEKRHIVMQWYNGVCDFQQKHIRNPGEITGAIPNGVVAAYYSLAYDLYVLSHHQLLQTSLVERLKQEDQFQGARYELFVAATAIRAGFNLEYEDETNGNSKHPEFVATHPVTGEKIAIEAKSRHRDGVLGRPGSPPIEEERAGVKRLLSNASEKIANLPFVLFLDVNLPPSDQPIFDKPWVKEVMDALVYCVSL